MNSKVEIRLEAVRNAVMVENITPSEIIPLAREIEHFIIGDADFPEQYNSNDYLEKMMESLKCNSYQGGGDAVQSINKNLEIKSYEGKEEDSQEEKNVQE